MSEVDTPRLDWAYMAKRWTLFLACCVIAGFTMRPPYSLWSLVIVGMMLGWIINPLKQPRR